MFRGSARNTPNVFSLSYGLIENNSVAHSARSGVGLMRFPHMY
jgi:hypothetical protein